MLEVKQGVVPFLTRGSDSRQSRRQWTEETSQLPMSKKKLGHWIGVESCMTFGKNRKTYLTCIYVTASEGPNIMIRTADDANDLTGRRSSGV